MFKYKNICLVRTNLEKSTWPYASVRLNEIHCTAAHFYQHFRVFLGGGGLPKYISPCLTVLEPVQHILHHGPQIEHPVHQGLAHRAPGEDSFIHWSTRGVYKIPCENHPKKFTKSYFASHSHFCPLHYSTSLLSFFSSLCLFFLLFVFFSSSLFNHILSYYFFSPIYLLS